MQRTIVLIRHAKAEVSSHGKDFDRPLTSKGKEDAVQTGKALKEKQIYPDLIISSGAKRTRQTAKRIAKTLGYDPHAIHYEPSLYLCDSDTYVDVIHLMPKEHEVLFIVGHNPGITAFANRLSTGFQIDNLSTCGIVAARTDADDWLQWHAGNSEVVLYQYP